MDEDSATRELLRCSGSALGPMMADARRFRAPARANYRRRHLEALELPTLEPVAHHGLGEGLGSACGHTEPRDLKIRGEVGELAPGGGPGAGKANGPGTQQAGASASTPSGIDAIGTRLRGLFGILIVCATGCRLTRCSDVERRLTTTRSSTGSTEEAWKITRRTACRETRQGRMGEKVDDYDARLTSRGRSGDRGHRHSGIRQASSGASRSRRHGRERAAWRQTDGMQLAPGSIG
jgi:hypothetical protein